MFGGINKYLGFYELKEMNLPTVPWRRFTSDTLLDDRMLWSVRMAVAGNDDLNLPRLIGASSNDAMKKGLELLNKYDSLAMVVYYPYFIADKSGVLEVSGERTVIEAVDRDLWNLVSKGIRNVTMLITSDNGNESIEIHGDGNFLTCSEQQELRSHVSTIKGRFREHINEGKSIFAEWSFAYDTDAANMPLGERYLVFYELRTVR